MLMGVVVMPSASAEDTQEKRTHWDFSEYTDSAAISEVAAETSEEYDGLEIHLGAGDSITEGGLVWTKAGGTKSDGKTTVSNNRYIKYTADKAGKLVITFKSSYQVSSGSNNNPRLYVISGNDLSCTTKNNSTDNGAYVTVKTADTDTTLEAEVEANATYYIWGYCFSHEDAPFTITTIDIQDIVPEITTRNIYGSNMLLQRDKPVYIDGNCTPVVTSVTAELIKTGETEPVQTKTATVNGREWNLTLDAVSDYSSAYSLVFKANGTDDALLTYDNILFGDVYLFSGQSNMWKEVSYYKNLDSTDYAKDEVGKHTTDKIRVMYTQGSGDTGTAELQYDARNAQAWKDFSTYSNVSPLPAVVFTTATTLYEQTDVPIGVIANAYPGSYISSWFDSALAIDACNLGKNKTSNERNWYCGRIYPLRNLELSGVFWYQGEADAAITYHGAANGEKDANGDTVYSYYKRMMGNLITSWRALFDIDDLPFYYVQLCRLGRTTDENNPDTGSQPETPVKLAQTDTYLEMEDKTNVGVVGTLDLFGKYEYVEGNSKSGNCRTDIHPTRKKIVGERLAAYALKDIYNKTQYKDDSTVYTTGPLYKSAEVDEADSSKVIVTFDTNGQLKIMDKAQYADSETDAKITAGTIKTDELNEFEIQDASGWHAASAVIQGTDKVVVSADGVTAPTGVRYAYSDYPDAPNLTDNSDLPSYTFMVSLATEEPEPEPEPAGTTQKFDFGGEGAADGYTAVSADRSFSDNLDYGFIGLKEDDYKLAAGQYMDSFRTVKGQTIELENGTRTGDAPDNDFVALKDPQKPLRFTMAAENGGYYHVKVRLVNASDTEKAAVSLFGERRHQLLTNKEIPAGGYIDYEFNADVETYYWKALSGQYKDDTLSIELVGKNAAISAMEVTKLDTNGTTLWVLGDSTGCDQPSNYPYYILNPYAGVGQALSKYLPKNIALNNQGDGGIASGDVNHYSVIKSEIKKGDYLYVEFGHNESGTAKYKGNLETYYNDCHAKGAYLVIVGPIDRCQEKQFDSATGTWSSTLSRYSDTGKEFVEEKIAAGAKDIAFVDLNASWIEFLNTTTKRVQQIRTEAAGTTQPYEKNSVDYYYKYKASGVDQSHINDAGADNAAYIFFTQAKAAVESGKTAEEGSYAKVNSDVLSGLVEGMREETPYTVPEEVIRAGKAPNSYYPTIPVETYEGYETDITSAEINNNGLLTSISAKVMHYDGFEAKGIPYAVAIAEIYGADGEKTGAYQSTTATKYDATNGNGTFTLKFDSPKAVIPEDGSYRIHLQGFTSDNTVMEGGENQVSDYYTGEKPLEYLIGDYDDISVPDTFMYYGVKTGSDLNSNNDWYIIGSSSKSVKLMTEGEGSSKTGYAEIRKTGTSGSFVLYRAFENKYSTGKITLDTDLYYEGGYAKFQLSNKTNAPHTSSGLTQYIDCFYIDSDGKVYDSDKNALGDFPKNAWTHVKYVLDLDRGTQTLKVGSAEYSFTAQKLETIIPSDVFPSSVQQLNIVGAGSKVMTINMKNTFATHTTNTDLEEKTLTLVNPAAKTLTVTAEIATDAVLYGVTYEGNALKSVTVTEKTLKAGENIIDVADIEGDKIMVWDKQNKPLAAIYDNKPAEAHGTVAITGVEGFTKTAAVNTTVTVTAAPKAGYKFGGWYEGETLISSDAETSIRLHRDVTLEAKFKPLVNVTVTAATANDAQGTATVNGGANATVLEDETVTLKATPKDGYKFAKWTDSEDTELSTSWKYVMTATKTETITANFTALSAGEIVWDFSNLPSASVVDNTSETVNKPYGALDIHLGEGDSLGDDGIYWAHPGTTTSDTTVVSNNRYIKYTAAKAGTLSVTFHSSYTASKANNNPRMYIISGADESCMNKSGSDSGAQATTTGADKDTTVTVTTVAGTTYYIWPYCFNGTNAPFNITNITFTE